LGIKVRELSKAIVAKAPPAIMVDSFKNSLRFGLWVLTSISTLLIAVKGCELSSELRSTDLAVAHFLLRRDRPKFNILPMVSPNQSFSVWSGSQVW
jgi:hypothetical protein